MDPRDFGPTKPVRSELESIQLRQCKLVVLKGPNKGLEVTIAGDVIRIGKAESNDLTLVEDTVSRQHCEILMDSRGYLLRDLGSTNGTFLDGAEVREAYVRSGAVVTVGTVQLRFQPFEERIQIMPSDAERLGGMVGKSFVMRQLYSLVERVAATEATVLIEGETGTGKDLVARTIHELSPRCDRPFEVVDCGAVAANLVESELFGHEKGAFTGATAARQGAFERANGGTVFLDELGELSMELQPKLLRVLEQREIRRVGGSRSMRVDIRVIAATKQDLQSQVAKGKFREDLYFRLAVVPIQMPSLRERKEDIPLLVGEFGRKFGGEDFEVPKSTVDSLMAHDWPGNIRELRNIVERGVYLSQQMGPQAYQVLGVTGGFRPEGGEAQISFDSTQSYRVNKERWNDEFERRYLKWLLERAGGNVSRASREADMDRKYLHKLLKKHHLKT